MKEQTANSENTTDREIFVSRIFDAPQELAFKAWTDPNHVANWWGPKGFTNTISEMSVKPGGIFRFIMHGPDGRDYPNLIIFREVVKPERLVYDHGSDDPADPTQFHVTVTFEKLNNQTKITMRSIFATAEELERVVKEYGALEGAYQHFDCLAEYLETMPGSDEEFVASRVYDAPRELVFQLWTEIDHLDRWWGPKGAETVSKKLELHTGGMYHYFMRAFGIEIWGKWIFREVDPPQRLVFVASFSNADAGLGIHPLAPGWPKETLTVVQFEDLNSKTKLIVRSVPINASEQELKLFTDSFASMEMGWGGTMEQLENYLTNLQKK